MKRLEDIKENIPKIINFAPMGVLIAVVYMVMVNALILDKHIFGYGDNVLKVLVLLIIGFFISVWASLHNDTLDKKWQMVVYGVAMLAVAFLWSELFIFDHSKEVVFFKSFFITMGFILLYVTAPFIKKRDDNLRVLMHLHHLRYAFLGSLRLGVLFVIALIIIANTFNFLFGINLQTFFTLLGFNVVWGTAIYIFFTTLMVNPHTITPNIKPSSKSYLTWLLYGFTAIIFATLNLFVLKIVITQTLPKGQVAWMVMGFSFFAFLSYLSLLPQKEKIKKYNTIIWGTLFVQSLVLLGSIAVRLFEYGVTENRYMLVAYGLWLFAISLYFLWNRVNAKIFWLFASLSLVVLLSQVGPINGYSISRYSQQHRFMTILESYKKEEVLKKDSTYHDLYSIFRYLKRTHGEESVLEMFPNTKIKNVNSLDVFLKSLGMKFDKEALPKQYTPKHYRKMREEVLHISNYDYLLLDISKPYGSEENKHNIDQNITLHLMQNRENISIKILDEELQFNIKNFAIKLLLLNQRYLPTEEMNMVQKEEKYEIKLIFSEIKVNPNSKNVEDWKANIYVKKRGLR